MNPYRQFIKSLPLKVETALVVAVLAAVSVAALATTVVFGLENDYERQIGNEQATNARYVARSIDDYVRTRLNTLEILAEAAAAMPGYSPSAMQRFLSERYSLKALFTRDVYVISPDGVRIAENTAQGTTGASYAETDYFKEVKQTHRPVVRAVLGRFAKKPVMIIAVPIINKTDGSILGVLCGSDLIEGESVLYMSNTLNGLTGGFFVYSPAQEIWVSSVDRDRMLQPVPQPGANSLFDRRREGYLGAGRTFISNGIEVISAAALVSTPDWMVISYMPVGEALGPLRVAIWKIYLGAGLIIAFIAAVTWFHLRRALAPLEKAVDQILEQRLNPESSMILAETGNPEIRLLIGHLNILHSELLVKNVALRNERDGLDALIQERTKEYQNLYNGAPCGYHTLSPQGIVLRVNKTELKLLGYSEGEYVGHKISDFMSPESARIFAETFPVFLQSGRIRGVEFDYRRKDGSPISFIVDADLVRDDAGNPLYSHSVLTDNTERKARDAQINSLNRFLQEVVETLPFGLVVLDGAKKIVLTNGLFSKLLDFPKGYIKAGESSFSDIVRYNHQRGDYGDRSYEEVFNHYSNAMVTKQAVQFERRQANGAYLSVSGLPLLEGRTLLTYTDISAHKQTELTLELARTAAEASALAKSTFVANMSHEIRTPMNAILGITYLLERSNLPGEAPELVKKIRVASRSLLSIVNDVLDFSKIDSGKLEIQAQPFVLEDVLDNLSSIMANNAREKDLELVIDPTPRGANHLIGDSLRLEQVLINLVGNAIKFTNHGFVSLKVRAVRELAESVAVRFSVCDSGVGIAADKLEVIFAQFSQADGSTSRRYGGSGLGLTISRHLVEAMGGELNVTSTLGNGSEFWFELNFDRSLDTLVSRPESRQLSICIVEDNLMTREALNAIAVNLGWQASNFASAHELIERLQAWPVERLKNNILLIDYKIPGMDGLEMARLVRHGALGDAAHIVILASSYCADDLMQHPDAGLADAVLTKPVTQSSLYKAATRALQVRADGEVQSPTLTRERLKGLRLLVVDDSDINREVAQRIFESEGAQVYLAENGKEAIELLEAHVDSIDIVLMDIQMPVLNGYDATYLIRRKPAFATIPIVAISAGALAVESDKANEVGITDFITKPFDVDFAIALVRKLTGHDGSDVPTRGPALSEPSSIADNNYPGLDIEKAIAIWKDVSAYQSVLRRFAVEYGDVVARLRSSGDSSGSALAHRLKGVAGSLGLAVVSALAGEVEILLHVGMDATDKVAQLEAALHTALLSINQYAPNEILPWSPKPIGRPMDPRPLSDLLEQLLASWRGNSARDVKNAMEAVALQLPLSRIAPLKIALEQFDFRAGERATKELLDNIESLPGVNDA